jgi:hypothetical protein
VLPAWFVDTGDEAFVVGSVQIKERNRMRFVMFTFPDPEYAATWLEIDAAEREIEIDRHREWFARHRDKVAGGEELAWPIRARTVRRHRGEPVVTDGPFIESKEILGGFIVLDVADMDEATALAAEWPSLRHAGSVVQVQAVETG